MKILMCMNDTEKPGLKQKIRPAGTTVRRTGMMEEQGFKPRMKLGRGRLCGKSEAL